MVRYLVILLLSFILMASSCEHKETDDCHRFINIENNSNYELTISISNLYPDSVSSQGFGSFDASFNPSIPAHTTGKLQAEFYNCLENSMNSKSTYKHGVMMLFFFNKQIVSNVSWDTIIKKECTSKSMI